MTVATENKTMVIHANKFDSAIVVVIAETEKAVQIESKDNGCKCWLPKAALKPYKPGVATYENEYEIARWIDLSYMQEKVLNLAE
jgi:hypothetical protein